MWASEITRHCGIHRWISNSIVVHAVSEGPPEWNFERKEEVFPLFSHEPIVARAPTGEYVMYFTHFDGKLSLDWCLCMGLSAVKVLCAVCVLCAVAS